MKAWIAAVILLGGCASAQPETKTILKPVVITAPAKVEIRYVKLPDSLTADCREVYKSKDPNIKFEDEATRLSNERLAANNECTERMRKIRAKQGQLVE